MLSARAYKEVQHDVLVVDTKKLVELEYSDVRLSRMNSGCTRPFSHPRDLELFETIAAYPFELRRKKSGKANALAEVCVVEGVERIEEAVVEVKRGFAGEIIAALEGG